MMNLMMIMVIHMMMKMLVDMRMKHCITCILTYALANNPSCTGRNSSEPGGTFFNHKDDDLDDDHMDMDDGDGCGGGGGDGDRPGTLLVG